MTEKLLPQNGYEIPAVSGAAQANSQAQTLWFVEVIETHAVRPQRYSWHVVATDFEDAKQIALDLTAMTYKFKDDLSNPGYEVCKFYAVYVIDFAGDKKAHDAVQFIEQQVVHSLVMYHYQIEVIITSKKINDFEKPAPVRSICLCTAFFDEDAINFISGNWKQVDGSLLTYIDTLEARVYYKEPMKYVPPSKSV